MGLFGRKKDKSHAATTAPADERAGLGSEGAQQAREQMKVLVKLRDRAGIEEPPGYDIREPLPGLAAPITLDYPDRMVELWGDLDKVGMDAAAAYDLAIANLRDLPVEMLAVQESSAGEPNTTVHVAAAQDSYASGRVFLVHELLAQVGDAFPEHGILLCVPNAMLLAFHVPRDMGVLGGLSTLQDIAQGECRPETGGISPHGFHLLPDGTATQCTRVDHEGNLVIYATAGPLHSLLLQLGVINA